MPKNTTGGNKHKKQAKGAFAERAKFLAADPDSQHYGICMSVLGNSRFEIIVYEKEKKKIYNPNTGKEELVETGEFNRVRRIGIARRGLKKKRMFVNKDTYVIVSLRDFQKDVCDIIHAYTDSYHINILRKKKLIPDETGGGANEVAFEMDIPSDDNSNDSSGDESENYVPPQQVPKEDYFNYNEIYKSDSENESDEIDKI
jgi:translation initiation factor IF-1